MFFFPFFLFSCIRFRTNIFASHFLFNYIFRNHKLISHSNHLDTRKA
jgi:hypothetical protein